MAGKERDAHGPAAVVQSGREVPERLRGIAKPVDQKRSRRRRIGRLEREGLGAPDHALGIERQTCERVALESALPRLPYHETCRQEHHCRRDRGEIRNEHARQYTRRHPGDARVTTRVIGSRPAVVDLIHSSLRIHPAGATLALPALVTRYPNAAIRIPPIRA